MDECTKLDSEWFIFLLTTRAGGLGINLHRRRRRSLRLRLEPSGGLANDGPRAPDRANDGPCAPDRADEAGVRGQVYHGGQCRGAYVGEGGAEVEARPARHSAEKDAGKKG